MIRTRLPFLPAAAMSLAAAGCSIAPDPIMPATHVARAMDDMKSLYAGQPPIERPLTMPEAVARALKFNYDHQLALAEVALQNRQFDVAVMNMLPRLALGAGYTTRSNENASSSVSVITRQQSLEPSTSQDILRSTGDLSFSWNLLDVGVGFFQARQQADRALIALERRRRVVNNIVKEVRSSFWRAATAQRLLPRIDPVLAEAEKALAANAQIEDQSLEPVVQTLEYRKNLLQVINQLRRLKSDLSIAKAQLAALINLPPGSEFKVVEPPEVLTAPRSLPYPVEELEVMALSSRPELREEAYQERVDRNNLYKEIARMVPGLSLMGSSNFDSNSYLVNNLWAEAGMRATFNLVNLVTGPTAISAAEMQIEVARKRRLALSVAVLTQIHVSHQQYQRAIETYDMAKEIARVEAGIAKAAADAGTLEAEPEFERIRRALSAIAAELDRDRAFTEVQTALANLYGSLGVDAVSPAIEITDLTSLTHIVGRSLEDLDRGILPPLPAPDPDYRPSRTREETKEDPPPAPAPSPAPVIETAPVAEPAAPLPPPPGPVPTAAIPPGALIAYYDLREIAQPAAQP